MVINKSSIYAIISPHAEISVMQMIRPNYFICNDPQLFYQTIKNIYLLYKITPKGDGIGGSRRAPPVCAPLRVQILSFWHTNLLKHSRPPWELVPPLWGWCPPMGNPGSTTGWDLGMKCMTDVLTAYSTLSTILSNCLKTKVSEWKVPVVIHHAAIPNI